MTLKFPLINLIARGHLPLANRTSCLNFAKNIEDGPATRICYEMMKCDDLHQAAKFLEEAVEAHRNLAEGTRAYLSESTSFTNARNMILMRESVGDMRDEVSSTINPYEQFMHILKAGGIGAATIYILKLNKSEQDNILRNLKMYNKVLYKQLRDNIIGRHVLPQHPSYFTRLYKAAVGSKIGADEVRYSHLIRSSDEIEKVANEKFKGDTKKARDYLNKLEPGKWLSQSEKDKFVNIAKKGGWGVAIAAGITVALVGISMLYKRFFSVEAKACNSVSGKSRTVCMTKARIKACDAAINASKKALLECSSAKNEEDCIFKMKVEIRSWTKKKALEEEKLRKLTNVNSVSFNSDTKKNNPFS